MRGSGGSKRNPDFCCCSLSGLHLSFPFGSLAHKSLFSTTVLIPSSTLPTVHPPLSRGCRQPPNHGHRRLIIDGAFFPPSVQANQQAAPTHSHVSVPADSFSVSVHVPACWSEYKGKQRGTHTCTHTHTRRTNTEETQTECVCVSVDFIPPGILKPNQLQRAQIKAAKIKSSLFDQDKKTCLHWLQACMPHMSLQLYPAVALRKHLVVLESKCSYVLCAHTGSNCFDFIIALLSVSL